jgi:hypothetical protein
MDAIGCQNSTNCNNANLQKDALINKVEIDGSSFLISNPAIALPSKA